MGEVRTTDDVHDLVHGLTLLGTGGGGRPAQGLESLLPHVEDGRSVGWVAPEAIPDDAWVCSTFGMGSMAPTEPLSADARRALGYPAEWTVAKPMVRAVQELEAYTGYKVSAILPFELGAGNTASPMDAAVRLGAAIVDGDCAGRAIPELCQTSAALAGFPFAPGAIVDAWGNVLLVKQTASELLTERIGKLVSIATKVPDMTAPCAHAGFLMTGKDLKRVAVPGGITRALAVGRAIRAARARGGDPVPAVAGSLGGWVLFRGRVARKEWESRDGYMYGTTTVEGEGADAGHVLRVWFKNENHVTWRDGTPWVLSPDLIMTMDVDGTPYTNTLLPEGAHIGVIGAVADARLRTPAALDLLGPHRHGDDRAIRPREDEARGEPRGLRAAKASVAGVPYAAGVTSYLPLLPLITDAVVDALTLAGTVDEVTERVIALGRAGIGQIMIFPFAPPDGRVDDTIRRFGQEVLPAARKALGRQET